MLRIDNIKIREDLAEEEIISFVLTKYKIAKEDVLAIRILKKSIDARDKKDIYYNYSLAVNVKKESKYPKFKKVEEKEEELIQVVRKSQWRPIIVGAGPAGLFCALTLVDHGFQPIILEQGASVEERMRFVEEYRNTGNLNERCNVQFGEGGAGTFSDGKLTTGISSPYIKKVLSYFHQFGAPKEITYLNKPHIGTDNLVYILKNIRDYIEKKGGTYYFGTKMIDIKREDMIHVICENQEFKTDALVLAIGHSARDTYRMLQKNNFALRKKNFAVGLRIEHKQQMINESQYGTYSKLALPPAEYKLAYHNAERSCFTFCMCPGGEVIASSSEKGAIVTNGMSTFKRDKENANSAILVNILESDFASEDPLAGMYFQEKLEKSAYLIGGENGFAPVQRVEDFLLNRKSASIGSIIPTYKPGYTLSNLNDILPSFVAKTLKDGIKYFDTKINGFAHPDAILTGVETRSSSPVTILRNEVLESNIEGIYPCGEGAGYAGGITSAAVDGIKVAIKIMEKE